MFLFRGDQQTRGVGFWRRRRRRTVVVHGGGCSVTYIKIQAYFFIHTWFITCFEAIIYISFSSSIVSRLWKTSVGDIALETSEGIWMQFFHLFKCIRM
ncbi:hypothetical protein HanIR_Chr09g0414681 [Helianthus annuus]|nr:hypothetical protein HanIR_Chr09g0414681 [Helianthus annuus]